MSVKQFEQFLGDHFIHWALDQVEPGQRYQFKSPDSERSLKLYNALCSSSSNTRSIKGVELPAIKLKYSDIIPVYHDEGDKGFSENFISLLRDDISSQQGELEGCALLIIHDSMLDTLNNSAKDLAQEGLAWHPKQIKNLLYGKIDRKQANSKISECLLDFQFNEVVAEGATMFGFEPLYDAISDGDLLFDEVGLLRDDTILDFDDPAQIKQRLQENKDLCEKLEFLIHHFPTELPEKLASEDFSDEFISKYFPQDDVDYYKGSLTLGEVQAEQAKNRTNVLELEKIISPSGELIQKSKSEKGAGLREKHLILVLEQGSTHFEFEVTFLNGKVQKNHCKIQHNKGFPDCDLSIKNAGGVRSRIVITSLFTGEARMFSLQVKTDKPKETHKFRILVLQRDDHFIESFKNNYLIDPHKSWITLQTDETTLRIGGLSNKTEVSNNQQVLSAEQTGVVDFKKIVNESDDVYFSVKGKYSTLTFNVEGEVATDILQLPLLLDRTRNSLLYTDSYYGVFNSSKNKVLIDGKEVAPKGRRLTLLQYEADLLQSATLAVSRNLERLYVSDIRKHFVELYSSYRDLFEWLENRKTLLTLEGWGTALRSLVDKVAIEYLVALNKIPLNTPLSRENRKLLTIGFAHLGDENNQQEYMTPFHPLVLAYNSFLTNELSCDKMGAATFKHLPTITIQRLVAQGLLPFLYNDIYGLSYNLPEKENSLWSKIVPQKDSSYDFVRTLVKDKTGKFVVAFKSLFSGGEKSQLIINSINNQQNRELFLGVVDYVKTQKDQIPSIHVNLYDDHEYNSWFDIFSETASYEQLKEFCELNKGGNKDRADSIVDLLRTRLTYSKYQHGNGKVEQKYAHISFFKNNEKVRSTDVDVTEQESGVVSGGLMPGEAASNKNGSYFTAFGLKDVDVSQAVYLQLAQKINGLIKPAVRRHEVHSTVKSQALVVTDRFRELLERSYQNSIWTTIIDPKVTLDFFESQKDVVLIHYSDSYTNSVNYDAITVTKQTDLYQKVLENDNGGVIEEFNAFNGEWLLNMITAGPNERKEKRGIIGAYKYINCVLAKAPITWVPLSIAEVIRVAGNLGLSMSESDFSRYAQGIQKGAISDDILFAGFYEDKLILLPVEVKTGTRQTHSKGVEQAKELKRYFTELLGQKTLAGRLYRGLFIRQVLMQIDKYSLYNVYEPDYFNSIAKRSAWWLDGSYDLAEIQNYPGGFLVVNVEDESFSTATFMSVQDILKIELPAGALNTWVNTRLGNLFKELSPSKLHNIPSEYILESEFSLKATNIQAYSKVEDEEEFVPEEIAERDIEFVDSQECSKAQQKNVVTQCRSRRKKMSDEDLQQIYQQIIDCYYSYSISVHVPTDGEKFVEGPASILFRVEISVGTDPKKLFDKSQALKLALKLEQEQEIGFAIDKGAVTIDVPKASHQRYFVDQTDIWAPHWVRPKSALEVPIGEDRHGVVIPLNFSSSNCPHLLIGGTTGSGKSEALNTILYGMVEHYKSTELKLMLIDPKGTELTDFEGYPHLIGEVGWDDQDALELLSRAVDEMQMRYALFKEQRVRSLPDYNAVVSEEKRIPWWVLVLDEYADLTSDKEMKKNIERELKRLAQKARAAGIHLVLATQKPSADVISTNLRSNLPAQLALRVKNGTESRVIIDEQGAEVLNGKGDAYLKSEGKLVRVQCAKVSGTLDV